MTEGLAAGLNDALYLAGVLFGILLVALAIATVGYTLLRVIGAIAHRTRITRTSRRLHRET